MGDISSEAHLRQTLANIAGDARLSDPEKEVATELAMRQHQELAGDPTGNPSTWDDTTRDLKAALIQPAEELAAANGNERLGNVCSRMSMRRAIADQLRCNDAEATRLIDLLLVRSAAEPLTKDQETDLEAMRERVKLRANDNVWLFQNEADANDPFSDGAIGDAPCRLGLPYQIGWEFLAFTVPASVVQNGYRPCVYDPGWHFQELWRPTGRTKPVCVARPVAAGHPEWVCTPPSLADIDEVVRLALVEDCTPPGTDCYD